MYHMDNPVVLFVGNDCSLWFEPEGTFYPKGILAPHLVEIAENCKDFGVAKMSSVSEARDFIFESRRSPVIVLFFVQRPSARLPKAERLAIRALREEALRFLHLELPGLKEGGHLIVPCFVSNARDLDLDQAVSPLGVNHVFIKSTPRQFINDLYKLGHTMNLALEERRAHGALLIDDLTNLFNRRAFRMHVRETVKRAHRPGHREKVFLMYWDMDYLKKLNDEEGHNWGDAALEMIGNVARRVLGSWTAWIYRLSGDEFAAIFSGVDLATMEELRWKLGQVISVQKLRIHHKTLKNRRITVTVGFAEYQGEGPDEFLEHAETQMRHLKLHKKNARKD